MRTHVLALLNRHNMVFGNYRWTEFDEEFLQKHVESVVLVDLGDMVAHPFPHLDNKWFVCFNLLSLHSLTFSLTQPLDLEKCFLSIHIFTLNEDGPSTLTLEDDEELSAANHWLLPAGDTRRKHTEEGEILRRIPSICDFSYI